MSRPAHTAHPVHIPIDKRKIIAARLIFFEAAEPFALEASLNGAETQFNSFRTIYHTLFDAEAKKSPHTDPLDKFLTATLAAVKIPGHALFTHHLSLFDSIWNEIEKKAGSMSCGSCSHILPQVCDGGHFDNEIVAHKGYCIKPLHALFDLARKVTDIYYRQYATLASTYPPITFSTGFCSSKETLHDIPVALYVSGVTEFPQEGHVTQVKLRIIPELFDRQTYAANLYVLFHECIAHAFHAISPSAVGRTPLPAFDQFSEGWMDWVAFKVLEEFTSNRGPARKLLPKNPFFYECISKGREYHDARMNFQHAGCSIYTKLLFAGATAARNLLSLLENKYPADPDNALKEFYALSFNLNMLHEKNKDKKAAFVSLVMDLPADWQPVSYRHELTFSILNKYLQHKDINVLLDQAYVLKLNFLAE
jgi:hypothetical protein